MVADRIAPQRKGALYRSLFLGKRRLRMQNTLQGETPIARRTLILYNPKAGSLKARQTKNGDPAQDEGATVLQEAAKEVGLDATIEPTPPPEALHQRLLAAQAEGYEVVAAAGGDGTVRPLAQALVSTSRPAPSPSTPAPESSENLAMRAPSLALGVLPVGTDNNFAHSLGIPFSLPEAMQILATAPVRHVDVGRIGEEYFLEAAGVGLFAQIISLFGPDGPRLFRFGRDWRLLLPLLLNPPARRLQLMLDGIAYAEEVTMASICNSVYLGARFAVAPDAKLDDGLFDVILVGTLSRWELLRFAFALRFGNNLQLPKVTCLRAREVEISRARYRQRPLPVHADDHIAAYTPVKIEVVPQALRVIAPEEAL
jgi:diacylglycerol kinase (ATP)